MEIAHDESHSSCSVTSRETPSNNIENSIPGSTSPLVTPALNNYHQWYSLHGRFEKYFNITKYYSIGTEMELHWQWVSNFLDNYTATIITAPSYQPVLESKTLFLPEAQRDQKIDSSNRQNCFCFSFKTRSCSSMN